MGNLTASDKSVLIKLASSLPAGDETRRAILAGLKTASGDVNIPGRHVLGNAKVTSIQEAIRKVQALPKRDAGDGTEDGIFWVWEDGTAQQFRYGTMDDLRFASNERAGPEVLTLPLVYHMREGQGCWIIAYRGKGVRILKGEVKAAKFFEDFEKRSTFPFAVMGVAVILKSQGRVLWENPDPDRG